MADEPKTRSRSTQSDKESQKAEEQSAAEKRKAEKDAKAEEKAQKDAEAKEKREAEKKEREEKRAAEKEEREKKRAEEKEQKEKEREEAKAAKEQEKAAKRQEQIDAGEIIFANRERELLSAEDATDEDGDLVTFVLTEPKKEEVANRARQVIQDLVDGATEVPMPGKELAEEYGGGTVQWVAFFGMLRVLGYVTPYRFRTGERGESGLAYKWVGPTDDEFLDQIAAEMPEVEDAPDEDEADEVAEDAQEEAVEA